MYLLFLPYSHQHKSQFLCSSLFQITLAYWCKKKLASPTPPQPQSPPLLFFCLVKLMEGSLADELYSETLQLSRVKLDQGSTTNLKQDELCDSNGDDLWHEDASLGDGSDEDLDKVSDLDREWQRRRDQFHTIGYRDGVIAGKEASAQEGFNIGFKESVFVGYKWGLVRGVTSALACLPDGLKEKLVETQEARNKFQCLYKTVHSLSTDNALKLFHDGILKNKSVEQTGNVESSSNVADMQDRSSDSNVLENHFEELQSLTRESPTVKVHLTIDQ